MNLSRIYQKKSKKYTHEKRTFSKSITTIPRDI